MCSAAGMSFVVLPAGTSTNFTSERSLPRVYFTVQPYSTRQTKCEQTHNEPPPSPATAFLRPEGLQSALCNVNYRTLSQISAPTGAFLSSATPRSLHSTWQCEHDEITERQGAFRPMYIRNPAVTALQLACDRSSLIHLSQCREARFQNDGIPLCKPLDQNDNRPRPSVLYKNLIPYLRGFVSALVALTALCNDRALRVWGEC